MPYPIVTQLFQESVGLLGNAGVVTGVAHDGGLGYLKLRVFVNADQTGSYLVQQSRDQITWYAVGAATAVVASTPSVTDFSLALRYVRVVYTNGATPQGAFELDSALIAV